METSNYRNITNWALELLWSSIFVAIEVLFTEKTGKIVKKEKKLYEENKIHCIN